MADRKITDLTALAAGSQATGDLVTIVDVSEAAAADKNKKMTMENLFKGIPGNVGIGTSSPARNCEIAGGASGAETILLQLRSNFAADNTSSVLRFGNSTASDTVTGSSEIVGARGSSGSSLAFRTQSGASLNEALRIDSSGNVGIGESNPSSLLHVKNNSVSDTKIIIESTGTNSYPALRLKNDVRSYDLGIDGATDAFRVYDVTGTAERLRIDSSGRLLVGTTSSRLDGLLQVESVGSGDGRMHSLTHNQNTSESPVLRLIKSRGTAVGAVTTVQDDDNLGFLVFTGTDGTGNIDGAYISAEVNGTPGTNDMPTDLQFWTNSGAASPTERMRIQSDGDIKFGNQTASTANNSTAITHIDGGKEFWSGTAGDYRALKHRLYYVSTEDAYGFGVSTSLLEIQSQVDIGFFAGSAGAASGRREERIRILANGGLTFNGDTSAANALDDYEMGTFTVTILSGLNVTSYTNTGGSYVKIGDIVNFTIRFQAGGTNVGSHLRIQGLPYTTSNSHREGSASFGYFGNLTGNNTQDVTMHIPGNNDQIDFYNPDGTTFLGNSGNGIAGRTLHIRGFYFVD